MERAGGPRRARGRGTVAAARGGRDAPKAVPREQARPKCGCGLQAGRKRALENAKMCQCSGVDDPSPLPGCPGW
eukprot:355191-Chlamydomonas_euryale.AAC.4